MTKNPTFPTRPDPDPADQGEKESEYPLESELNPPPDPDPDNLDLEELRFIWESLHEVAPGHAVIVKPVNDYAQMRLSAFYSAAIGAFDLAVLSFSDLEGAARELSALGKIHPPVLVPTRRARAAIRRLNETFDILLEVLTIFTAFTLTDQVPGTSSNSPYGINRSDANAREIFIKETLTRIHARKHRRAATKRGKKK